MHLSRLTLNPRNRQVQSDLRNPYDLHRTLTFGWADEGQELPTGERVLWRLDAEQPPTLLVQSVTTPDWSRLMSRHPGYLDTFKVTALDPARLDALSQPEGRYRFRLRANPTVTKREDQEGEARNQKPKRYGLYSADAQAQWLVGLAARSGFVAERFEIVSSERFRARKGKALVTLAAATFEGELRVTDAPQLRAALQHGLGHGRAFGMGLLSLAPLS
ncbi:type I-E CRISPR-associated protein Cas6/Cse3/CasE [Deinococcus ruber]|uniref:CRISPR-associated endoribonuclease Cse3 n=1 Tax=Deinococcus ruber TaxID=1848197 RepID=A0A918F730_9DEIO|nr:type I-E CRISPR-associated protein Cas6/Cse3/CasE [Deinococcus ruber]GGR11459.1 CRISPR-associated endoribonuclease Cse3 [Deinococcus ruber]